MLGERAGDCAGYLVLGYAGLLLCKRLGDCAGYLVLGYARLRRHRLLNRLGHVVACHGHALRLGVECLLDNRRHVRRRRNRHL